MFKLSHVPNNKHNKHNNFDNFGSSLFPNPFTTRLVISMSWPTPLTESSAHGAATIS